MAGGTSELLMRVRMLLAAFKARRSAAAVMFVVAVLAIAAAAIGPMFLKSADTSVLTSAVRAAAPGQTDLTFIDNGGATQMSKLSTAAKTVEVQSGGLLSPPLFTIDVGSHFLLRTQEYAADILARSDICAHLTFVEGTCPRRADDVAISERSAAASDLGVGARLQISDSHTSITTGMTITGVYVSPAKVDNNYWKDENYFDYGTGGPPVVELDPLVATFATVLATSPVAEPQLSVDLAWRADATLSGASVLDSTVVKVKSTLFSHYGLAASTGLTSLISATRLDDDLMSTVVLAIVLQLILLSLLILYTLGRSTLLGRRQESEFARRHGFPRSALIALAIGEPATLIVAALPVGVLVAWGALALLTKTLFIAGTPVSFPATAVAFAVGTCVAGVAAMTVASSELWRSRSLSKLQATLVSIAVDAFAVALALTGLLSLATKGSLSGSHADPLAALAPGLLALGAGVIGLRLAAVVIRAVIARNGETSRVAWFLALRQIGRRPSVLRQLLPLTAATAVLLFAVGSFFLASSNRSLVAHFDVGAARVVDVTAPPLFNLEAAVRRADPSGREAMAVAYYSSPTGELLGVDTSRLAAVGVWPSALAPESLADLAHELSPRVPPGVSFSGDALRLTLGVAEGTPRIELGVSIFGETYQNSKTIFVGPIVAGLHNYTIPLAGLCTGTCRLTGLAPNWVNPFNPYSKKVAFVLHGVAERQGGQWRDVRFGAGHPGTWDAQPSSIHVTSTGRPCCQVAFSIPGVQLQSSGLILSPVNLPAATPAIVSTRIEITDPPVPPRGNLTLNLDGSLLTVHPLAFVSTLPLLGDHGALVDYVFAQRAIIRRGNDTTYQVWLAPSASPAILQRLRTDGVVIGPIALASTRLGELDHSGVALAYTVALFVAPIAALLAIGTVSFVIVLDGRRRRREFTSLSLDGVPTATVRRALLVENAMVLGVALVVGAAIGFATDSLAFTSLPEFAAGTGGLPISRAVPITPFLGAVAILALLLAGAVELTTRTVMRGNRARHDGGSME